MVNLIQKISFGSTIECVWPKLKGVDSGVDGHAMMLINQKWGARLFLGIARWHAMVLAEVHDL